MIPALPDPLSAIHLLELLAYGAAGFSLGAVYFLDLWWTTRLLASGGHFLAVPLLTIGRLVLACGLLALAGQNGALPLLLMALGILGGRAVIMRRFGQTTT